MKIIEEGTRGVALAPERGKVPVMFEYRDLSLGSGVVIKDVLVGVAEATGEVLTIPAQSTPRIKLARQAAKEETFSVRIPSSCSSREATRNEPTAGKHDV